VVSACQASRSCRRCVVALSISGPRPSAATKASMTLTRDRPRSRRRQATRTDRGGEPLAWVTLLRSLVRDQQRRGRGHTRTMSAEDTGLCHRRASPLGNSATGCRRSTASVCSPAIDGGPPARPPKALVAIRRPIIAAIWDMLTSGQPDHVVGATTARAAARKPPQVESSRTPQISRRADPAGSLGEHRPTRQYWGHLTGSRGPVSGARSST
jgi:hypothetical protein